MWPRGKPHSEATKEKIRANATRPWAGKHRSEDTKRKLRLFRVGSKLSEATKRKISSSLRGKFLGPKGTNWKGGVTPLRHQIRSSFEYRQWRSDIFTRDDFTCLMCGARGVELHADHHPRAFAEILSENSITTFEDALQCSELWNINNGQTLCVVCHKNRHQKVELKIAA